MDQIINQVASQGSPEGSLTGESTQYTASYVIASDAALSGLIINTVTSQQLQLVTARSSLI